MFHYDTHEMLWEDAMAEIHNDNPGPIRRRYITAYAEYHRLACWVIWKYKGKKS